MTRSKNLVINFSSKPIKHYQMKLVNYLISAMIAFSFLTFSSCTEYITIKTEKPDNPTEDNSHPSNTVKDPTEVLFNTSWSQYYVLVSSGNNPQMIYNKDASLEFSDIKYENTNKYIIKHNSETIGLYSMGKSNTITLDWHTIDPENGERYSNLYGEGQFEIKIAKTFMYYFLINGDNFIEYYYDKLPEK